MLFLYSIVTFILLQLYLIPTLKLEFIVIIYTNITVDVVYL